ncbi:MAG: hypothetical protein ABSC15_04310 [Terriglobales bacterium]|jgi:hypothetical protein
MNKAKASKARKRPKKARCVPKRALKQVDLGVIGEQITNLVGNRAIEMVEITMDEVDKGHYLAMKYLFEMIGLCPATAPEGAIQEDSLAKTLLRRLRFPEESDPGTEVTKECVAEPVEQESDAVK